MVDPGDTVSATLKKEFGEEALNSMELSEKEQEKVHDMLTKLFQRGQTVGSIDGRKFDITIKKYDPIIGNWFG